VGLVLDLAVVAVTLVVLGSLALLAWTVGISATRAAAVGRTRVAGMRRAVADAQSRLRATDDQGGVTTSE
jgi:hypothetical protein